MAKELNKKELSDNDVRWGLLNRQLLEHAQNNNWGLYRNARLDMAEILQKERKLKNALQTYLEICYLDLNGPNNMGGINDQEFLRKCPPFDPRDAFLAPKIVEIIIEILQELNLNKDEVKQIFIAHNLRTWQSLKLPVSPEQCWVSLDKELNIKNGH